MRLPFDELDVHAELESALRDWLPQEAPSTAPMDLRQRVFDRSVTIRQRDGRLRRVTLTRTRIGGLAFAAAGLGMAIVIGGMALFGGGVSETVGTSPSPSDMRPAPSPSASAPVALSPWVRGVPLPGDPAFDDPPPEYIGLDGGRILALRYSGPATGPQAAIDLVEYDPHTDDWTDRGRIDPRVGSGALANPMSGVAAKGTIYLIGHDQERRDTTALVAWPIDAKTLRSRSALPAPRLGSLVAVIGADGRIYVLETPFNGTEDQAPEAMRIYDPATDDWTDAPPIPTDRAEAVLAAAPDGGIWVIGGTTVPVWDSQAETHFEVLHSIERYDPSSGTWTDRANLPMDGPAVTTGSYSTVTFTPDGSLYVMTVDIPGGIRLQRLDALEARWSEEDTPPEPLTPAAMYPTGDGRLILFGSASQSDSSWGLFGPQVTWILDPTTPR